mgnify:FL=1
MNIVLFSWFISSDAFANVLDMDLKALLYQDRIKEIEDDLLPFGFIDNGSNNNGISESFNKVVEQQKRWMDI